MKTTEWSTINGNLNDFLIVCDAFLKDFVNFDAT